MNKNEKNINTLSDSFYGGVIYIDLRGYTKIVDEKPLTNIAEIIYSYQNEVKSIIENNFSKFEISSIQFVGDGVMAIMRNYENHDTYYFGNKLFEVASKLKNAIYQLIETMKTNLLLLNHLDFGIAISTSEILKKTVSEIDLNERDIYFGNSLNRAYKIGDSMHSKKNYIGIDKRMYDENNNIKNDLLENNNYYIMYNKKFVKKENPIVHLILEDN